MLSRTQAGPDRTVKQEQEEITRNHVLSFISPSVMLLPIQFQIYSSISVVGQNMILPPVYAPETLSASHICLVNDPPYLKEGASELHT